MTRLLARCLYSHTYNGSLILATNHQDYWVQCFTSPPGYRPETVFTEKPKPQPQLLLVPKNENLMSTLGRKRAKFNGMSTVILKVRNCGWWFKDIKLSCSCRVVPSGHKSGFLGEQKRSDSTKMCHLWVTDPWEHSP